MCPGVPVILVGTKSDLRSDTPLSLKLRKKGQRPVLESEGRRVAMEMGAVQYVECSALTHKGLKDVIDVAVRACLERRLAVHGNEDKSHRCVVM